MTSKRGIDENELLRWGILGTGKIARILAVAIFESETAKLAAVGSRDPLRAAAFADEFSATRSYGDYHDVIADGDVDIVYVATPHPHHMHWAVSAANAGRHVLCEKPIGVNHNEASRIVDAAQRNNVFLQEAYAYRSHPQTARLVDMIGSGEIGEIRLIEAAFGYDAGPDPGNYLFNHELAGGSLLDVGCYTTSMAQLIAATAGHDGPPEIAAGAHMGTGGVDATTAATLVFPGGLVARLASSIQVNLDNVVRIYGSKGQITVSSPWLPGRIGTSSEIIVRHGWTEPDVIDIPLDTDVYTIEVDALSRGVLAGERNPQRMTWEESIANMQTLDRWREVIGLRYSQDPDPASATIGARGNGNGI